MRLLRISRFGLWEALGLGGMKGRVAEYECLAVREIAMGREEMGWEYGCLVTIQIEGRAEQGRRL